jgi:hypothetical protein
MDSSDITNLDPSVPGLVPIEDMSGDDEEDTTLLRGMSRAAEAFLLSHSWCSSAKCRYFGGGVGGIFAIFLFKVDSPRPGVGSWIWTMVGDVPPAYLPLEDASTPAAVFHMYLDGMSRWVGLAGEGTTGPPEDGIPPVDVPATPEWAEKLSTRLNTMRLLLLSHFDPDAESGQVH